MPELDTPADPDAGFVRFPDHAGADYLHVLSLLHAHLRPQSYLEVGTQAGASLSLAKCASIAIDPQFMLATDVVLGKPCCLLFQMTSDQFFGRHDPRKLLGAPIEMAFLDGLHIFEFLLRDFLNVERCCERESVVLVHDCLPTDSHIARRLPADMAWASRSPYPEWWAGDVWKVVPALRAYRTDLKFYAFNASPTGILAVTNLDPGSQILGDNYSKIVEEFGTASFASFADFLDGLTVLETDVLESFEKTSQLFRL
jgi:hypothetical protein